MKNDQIELARMQFIGFINGEEGHSITSLAEGMGLTAEEWAVVKDDPSLKEKHRQEIDEYFEQEESK